MKLIDEQDFLYMPVVSRVGAVALSQNRVILGNKKASFFLQIQNISP